MSPSQKRSGSTGDVPPGPRLYSLAEIATALGCSEWWVKEQARKRRIPFSWIGGSYRFTAEHLVEIIQTFEVRPKPGSPGTTTSDPSPRRRTYRPAPPTTRLQARPPRRSRSGGSGSTAA